MEELESTPIKIPAESLKEVGAKSGETIQSILKIKDSKSNHASRIEDEGRNTNKLMVEFSNIAKLPPSNLKLQTEEPEPKIYPAKGDHEKPIKGKRKPKKIISFYKCEIISKSETQSRKKEYFKRRGSASSDKNRHILEFEPQPGPSGITFPYGVATRVPKFPYDFQKPVDDQFTPRVISTPIADSDLSEVDSILDDPEQYFPPIETRTIGTNTVLVGPPPILSRRKPIIKPDDHKRRNQAAKFLRILLDVPESRCSHSVVFAPAERSQIFSTQSLHLNEPSADPSELENIQANLATANKSESDDFRPFSERSKHLAERPGVWIQRGNHQLYLFIISVGISVFLLLCIMYVVLAKPMCPVSVGNYTETSNATIREYSGIFENMDRKLGVATKDYEAFVIEFVPEDKRIYDVCLGVILGLRWVLIQSICVVDYYNNLMVNGSLYKDGVEYQIKQLFLYLQETNQTEVISNQTKIAKFEALIKKPTVALILLARKLKGILYPATLPDESYRDFQSGMLGTRVNAFKTVVENSINGSKAPALKLFHTLVNIYLREICVLFEELRYYTNDLTKYNIRNESICAGNVHGFVYSNCTNEDHVVGPLIVNSTVILGLFQSNRNFCGGRKQLPVLYFNVLDYVHWISSVMDDVGPN